MKTIISAVIAIFLGATMMAQAPVSLKLNLENSKVYKLKSTSKQTVQQSVSGQQVNMDVVSNVFISLKQIGKENDVLRLEFKFDTFATIINSMMYKQEINSAKPAKDNEYFEKIMNRFSKFPLIAKISSSGKFLGFENYKEFKANVLEGIDAVPATQKTQVQTQADAYLKESTLQSMIEPIFSYLPDKAIKAGDQWEGSYMQPSSQLNLMIFGTYTLNGVENNTAKISGKSQIESMPSNEPAQAGAPKMTTDAKGTSTSELSVDVSTGLLLQNTATSHIDGTVTVNNQGNEMKVTLVADGKSEIINIK
jgi:hypothetical protein